MIIENNNTKLNYPASYFPILFVIYCYSTKNEPRNAVNSAFLGSCTLLEFNDCISVSTISCGFDSIKKYHIYTYYTGYFLLPEIFGSKVGHPPMLESKCFSIFPIFCSFRTIGHIIIQCLHRSFPNNL